MYGQDKIMDTLHNNIKIGNNEIFWDIIISALAGSSVFETKVLHLIRKTNKGEWDYKYSEEWRVNPDYKTFDGTEMYNTLDKNIRNYKEWIYFDGRIIGADKFGNINIAYVGYMIGLPTIVYENFTTTDGDDAEWVRYGINMAKEGR